MTGRAYRQVAGGPPRVARTEPLRGERSPHNRVNVCMQPRGVPSPTRIERRPAVRGRSARCAARTPMGRGRPKLGEEHGYRNAQANGLLAADRDESSF